MPFRFLRASPQVLKTETAETPALAASDALNTSLLEQIQQTASAVQASGNSIAETLKEDCQKLRERGERLLKGVQCLSR